LLEKASICLCGFEATEGSEAMPNYINVPVPEELIPAVMALISEHMGSKVAVPNPTPPAPAAPAAEAEPTTEVAATSSNWSEAELQKLWNESWPPMRKVLAKLAENGGKAVTGDELAKVIGKAKKGHSIAGMMGALGRRIKHRHKGNWPFRGGWNPNLYCWEYTMPVENAAPLLKFASAAKPQ
jgi:hypothetical protein